MRPTLARFLVPLFALGIASSAAAQPDHTHGAGHHDHGHGEKTPAAKRKDGRKWATDAPLREGMEAIKALVEAAVGPVHAGRMKPAGYEALGRKVDEQISAIFGSCKLAPDADAALHGVLASIMEGSKIVQTGEKRAQGVVKMIRALDEYGALFDHPGWTKVKH